MNYYCRRRLVAQMGMLVRRGTRGRRDAISGFVKFPTFGEWLRRIFCLFVPKPGKSAPKFAPLENE